MSKRWWVIHEEELLGALERAAKDGTPLLAYIELTAGVESEVVSDD